MGGRDDKTAVVVPLNVVGSGAPDGGPVAIGGLTDGERRDLLRLLPTVANQLRPLEEVVAGREERIRIFTPTDRAWVWATQNEPRVSAILRPSDQPSEQPWAPSDEDLPY